MKMFVSREESFNAFDDDINLVNFCKILHTLNRTQASTRLNDINLRFASFIKFFQSLKYIYTQCEMCWERRSAHFCTLHFIDSISPHSLLAGNVSQIFHLISLSTTEKFTLEMSRNLIR